MLKASRSTIDKIGLYIFLGLLVLILALAFFLGTSPNNYNKDMDLTRIKDIRTIGALIEEYKTKTGSYPLAQADNHKPLFTPIVTKKQQKYTQERPVSKPKMGDVKTLIQALEKGLDRKIQMPFDPQLRTAKRPIFYLYVVKGSDYELIAHLHNEYPFSRKVNKHYSKVTVSSRSVPELKIWKYSELMTNPAFVKTVATKLSKPDYIKKLRADIRKEGAF